MGVTALSLWRVPLKKGANSMSDKKAEPIRIKTAKEMWEETSAGKVPSLKDHVNELIRQGKTTPKK
jgi:hypothetical protein